MLLRLLWNVAIAIIQSIWADGGVLGMRVLHTRSPPHHVHGRSLSIGHLVLPTTASSAGGNRLCPNVYDQPALHDAEREDKVRPE